MNILCDNTDQIGFEHFQQFDLWKDHNHREEKNSFSQVSTAGNLSQVQKNTLKFPGMSQKSKLIQSNVSFSRKKSVRKSTKQSTRKS